jgi:hypothetical protein
MENVSAMAKAAARMTSIALRNGTDIPGLETAVARRSNRFSIVQLLWKMDMLLRSL